MRERDWSLEVRVGAFEAGPAAQVVVDADGVLAMANACARSLFSLTRADLGRPLGELDVSRRPVDLRPHLEEVRRCGHAVTLDEAGWVGADGAGDGMVQLHLTPLEGDDGVAGVRVTFADVSQHTASGGSSTGPRTSSSRATRSCRQPSRSSRRPTRSSSRPTKSSRP